MTEKVAVVTGTHKGIGFAIVKDLCEKFNGVVYLTTRDKTGGLETVEALNEIGLKPELYLLDAHVSYQKSVKEFAEFLDNKHGGFDVLVNIAAILEWDAIYPSYEVAKRTIDVNYKSLQTIEEYLYPLLKNCARVVHVSSACGHHAKLRNKKWIDTLKDVDLTTDKVDEFVGEYLESVKKGKCKKQFADDGKHAEHRIAKIAVTALTFIQQRKLYTRNVSINAIHPGYVTTDEERSLREAASMVLLILDESATLKGSWTERNFVDWLDAENSDGVHSCKEVSIF